MNKELSKAIMNRYRPKNNWNKFKSRKNFVAYLNAKNFCKKLTDKSKKKLFQGCHQQWHHEQPRILEVHETYAHE